jgi:hypothetical protein
MGCHLTNVQLNNLNYIKHKYDVHSIILISDLKVLEENKKEVNRMSDYLKIPVYLFNIKSYLDNINYNYYDENNKIKDIDLNDIIIYNLENNIDFDIKKIIQENIYTQDMNIYDLFL